MSLKKAVWSASTTSRNPYDATDTGTPMIAASRRSRRYSGLLSSACGSGAAGGAAIYA